MTDGELRHFGELLPAPKRSSINSGLSACRPSTLRRLLGEPRRGYSSQCQPVTNQSLRALIVTRSVGPFRVTGLGPAVESLHRVFERIKGKDVYEAVGTAGMLCCRLVRGSRRSVSNHSWGTAVDLTFPHYLTGESVVDPRGDGLVQRGCLDVYWAFHAEGWYWGAGFSREDAMHFELADETVRKMFE